MDVQYWFVATMFNVIFAGIVFYNMLRCYKNNKHVEGICYSVMTFFFIVMIFLTVDKILGIT